MLAYAGRPALGFGKLQLHRKIFLTEENFGVASLPDEDLPHVFLVRLLASITAQHFVLTVNTGAAEESRSVVGLRIMLLAFFDCSAYGEAPLQV